MAWTAPATATVGQILTAAFMNAQLRDNMLAIDAFVSLVSGLTDGGILLGSGTGAITPMAVLSAGEIAVGDGATDPVALQLLVDENGLVRTEQGGMEVDVTGFDGVPLIDGGATTNLKYSLDETDAPDANDDTTDGWKVGSIWVDITNDKAYICLDNTDTAAVWLEITQGQNHTIASHSDTSATGAELNTLTDGSDGSALHLHVGVSNIVTFSRTAAAGAGAQAITGMGFAPKAVWVMAVVNSTSRVSLGFGDDDADEADVFDTGDGATWSRGDTNIIHCDDGAGNSMIAVLTTLGSDGFTVTWTKGGSGVNVDVKVIGIR